MITVHTIKLRCEVVSESNRHRGSHWSQTKRKQAQKIFVRAALNDWLVEMMKAHPCFRPTIPARVGFIRFHKRGNGMDDDNLAGAFKSVRDAVAAWFETGDGPNDPIKWLPPQQAKVSKDDPFTCAIVLEYDNGGIGE